MIITVTLNAAMDKSLSVPNFRLGRRHRTVDQQTRAGGKGVNIARTLKTLGQPVIATGFAGGPTGTQIFRDRTSVLGDIVDSSPDWVGPPASPYTAAFVDQIGTSPGYPENTGPSYTAFKNGQPTATAITIVDGSWAGSLGPGRPRGGADRA